jgi:hypothetical protein
MEDRMRNYIIKRIKTKLKEGKTQFEVVEQLQALDSKRGVEVLLSQVLDGSQRIF